MQNDLDLIGLLGKLANDTAGKLGKGLGKMLNDLIDKLLPLND